MTDFRFIRTERGEGTAETDPLSVMIAAAGGQPLPGVYGLGQALVGIWTNNWPMPGANRVQWGLWIGKSALNTVGTVQAYQKSKNPQALSKKQSISDEFLEVNKLKTPDGFDHLGHLTYTYSDNNAGQSVERTDSILGASTENTWVRKFKYKNGTEIFYLFFEDPSRGAFNNGWFLGYGPFCTEEHAELLREGLSDLIWTGENGSDLQLTTVTDGDGYTSFRLSSIGPPPDYVSIGAADAWADVTKLAERCKAFQDKGMTRRIMFYGSPGCGKTTLARNLARQMGQGRTLRIEAEALSSAGAAQLQRFLRLLQPSVILFDDLDRTSEAGSILHYIEDSVVHAWAKRLIVISTVNSVTNIDPALLRPGRFDEVRRVEEPNAEHRLQIVRHYLTKHGLPEINAEEFSTKMDGWSPADIQETISCLAAVGLQYLDAEVERIRLQRALYEGDAVEKFLNRRTKAARNTLH